MLPAEPSTDLLPIGQFARLSGLTAKALRIYHDCGLLCPSRVDPTNGYRYYRRDQLVTARLTRHLERLEAEHRSRRVLTQHLHTILRGEDHPMYPIRTRQVPAQRVMSMQRRLLADQTDDFVAEAKAKFAMHLAGEQPVGPFIVIFHGIVDYESDGPLEAILGCSDEVEPTEEIGIRTEPAHDEAFTTITKSQWDFPAILAAYDAVASSPEAVARPGSRQSCREVYLVEPDSIGPDDLICDIAFPLGPA